MSFVEYLRIPDPTTVELMTVPVLFLAVLILTMLAGLRWHAALFVTACILAIGVMGMASQRGALSSETSIGAAVAAMLIVIFWKMRSRRRA
jgi:hypothetical protein